MHAHHLLFCGPVLIIKKSNRGRFHLAKFKASEHTCGVQQIHTRVQYMVMFLRFCNRKTRHVGDIHVTVIHNR